MNVIACDRSHAGEILAILNEAIAAPAIQDFRLGKERGHCQRRSNSDAVAAGFAHRIPGV